MSELDNKPYEVSFIASAPEELKVGDRIVVVNKSDDLFMEQGAVVSILIDGGIQIHFDNGQKGIYDQDDLRKLPDTISFYSDDFESAHGKEDSDNVKAFMAILNEMAETYKAKDADYGSAYDDGYRLFGHAQLLSRIYEKFSRVKHILDGNKPNVSENICDTLTDMSIQCIALRMLLQKNAFENVV